MLTLYIHQVCISLFPSVIVEFSQKRLPFCIFLFSFLCLIFNAFFRFHGIFQAKSFRCIPHQMLHVTIGHWTLIWCVFNTNSVHYPWIISGIHQQVVWCRYTIDSHTIHFTLLVDYIWPSNTHNIGNNIEFLIIGNVHFCPSTIYVWPILPLEIFALCLRVCSGDFSKILSWISFFMHGIIRIYERQTYQYLEVWEGACKFQAGFCPLDNKHFHPASSNERKNCTPGVLVTEKNT